MTIQAALSRAKEQLNHSNTAALDAEVLLCHVLGWDKAMLISRFHEELNDEQKIQFDNFVQERIKGIPIAYITQEKEFYNHSFFVDQRVLIPRPETEELIEASLNFLHEHPEITTVIDLGTGSGVIAVTLALELPDRKVIGIDISTAALEVAAINQERHHCSNLHLIQSNLLSNLPDLQNQPVAIIANLPYIGTEVNNFVDQHVHEYEPTTALYAGADGLDLYRKTWTQIIEKNLKLAAMFMEIGPGQGEQIKQESETALAGYSCSIKNDLAGLERMAILTQS